MRIFAKHHQFLQRNLILMSMILLCMFSVTSLMQAQDGPQRVYMYLNYFQNDQEQYLVSELKYRTEGQFYQLSGVEVNFSAEADTSEMDLGTVKTGEDGKARIDLKGLEIPRNAEGFCDFNASFAGNEGYKKAGKSISMKEIVLTMDAESVDSTLVLTVRGEEKTGGEMNPIEDTDFKVLTKRLYSDLPVAEAAFEDGEFEFEFPKDIPGDAFGDLWVIARITDHDDYGTVETREKVRWGVPVSYTLQERPRALWSRAPYWIMFLVGAAFLIVWYHYFMAISKLFKIRKL